MFHLKKEFYAGKRIQMWSFDIWWLFSLHFRAQFLNIFEDNQKGEERVSEREKNVEFHSKSSTKFPWHSYIQNSRNIAQHHLYRAEY